MKPSLFWTLLALSVFFSFVFTYGVGTVTCGLAHAWYKQFKYASVPKAYAWEVEGPKICLLSIRFPNLFHERPMQDDVTLEALSEAIVRCSLNFMKNVLWESTSRKTAGKPPQGLKIR